MCTYLSYHFDEVQGGKMNIFLLFLTTLFMIGYYVLYSPSQQVTNTTTEDVVRMSDLRAIAECVIGMENAKMNSEDYNDPCVERYKVSGEYVCANDKDGTIVEVLCSEGEPEYNFIVSYSGFDILTVDDYGPMLDIIERYYQDKGTFGIYENHKLLTASSSGNVEINSVIYGTDSSNARLQGGELVYVMQYKIPWTQEEIPDPEDPDSCVPPSVLMTIDGETVCAVPNPPSESCNTDGYVLNADGECVPLGDSECDELKGICQKACEEAGKPDDCLIPDCENMTCIELFECPSGTSQVVLTDEEYEECIQEHTDQECRCIPNITGDDPTVQCSDSQYVFTLSQITHQTGGTMQRRIPRRGNCGPCERIGGSRYNPDQQAWEAICVPDVTKIALPTCNDADPTSSCVPAPTLDSCYCNDSTHTMFFGFQTGSDSQCIQDVSPIWSSSATSGILNLTEQITQHLPPLEYQDSKWHCMECPNGVNTAESMWPYIAVCNP